jgi:hypothetical protein
MNIAVRLARPEELPCEGYPIKAITVNDNVIPSGYDVIMTVEEYDALKQSMELQLKNYQNSLGVGGWGEIVSKRNVELAATDWTDLAGSFAVLGYHKLMAYRIYRQQLRDITEFASPEEVVFPSHPSENILILTVKPKLTESNVKVWTDLLWRACYDFRFNYISDEGITKLNMLADMGIPKAIIVRDWIDSLWMTQYYPRKAYMLAGQETNFDFMTGNLLPFTVLDVLQEAQVMLSSSASSISTNSSTLTSAKSLATLSALKTNAIIKASACSITAKVVTDTASDASIINSGVSSAVAGVENAVTAANNAITTAIEAMSLVAEANNAVINATSIETQALAAVAALTESNTSEYRASVVLAASTATANKIAAEETYTNAFNRAVSLKGLALVAKINALDLIPSAKSIVDSALTALAALPSVAEAVSDILERVDLIKADLASANELSSQVSATATEAINALNSCTSEEVAATLRVTVMAASLSASNAAALTADVVNSTKDVFAVYDNVVSSVTTITNTNENARNADMLLANVHNTLLDSSILSI